MELRLPTVTPPSCRPGARARSRGVTRAGGLPPRERPHRPPLHGAASRVRPVPTRPGLLECIERYFAAAPLLDARIEQAGALDVPIGDPAWPYPARPRDGAEPVTADDVRAAV